MSHERENWTVRKLLEWTTPFFARKEVDAPRLSAELLLAHVLGIPRIKLYTDYERPLMPGELHQYRELVKRAAEQEPIAYLTGRAHFFNLEFHAAPGVLIPRPDTETLVENVMQFLRHQPGMESPRILDLCTGSGCIALALAHHLKTATVLATDISKTAVALTQKNIQHLNLDQRVIVAQGDLYEPLASMVDIQPFDLIVANPPYIPSGQLVTLDRNVRDYEPWEALDGGMDGLTIHRRILKDAPAHLRPGGQIYLEIAFDQAELAKQVFREHPLFEDVKILKDYAGKDRVITARRVS